MLSWCIASDFCSSDRSGSDELCAAVGWYKRKRINTRRAQEATATDTATMSKDLEVT